MAEADLAQLRQDLVQQLRRKLALTDAGVESAFSAIPRHLFLQHIDPIDAYLDQAFSLRAGSAGETVSAASQPTMMAIMLQQLELNTGMNVLEIGTASGYNAALIKHIVGDNGNVTSLEIDPELSDRARDNLYAAGFSDILVVNRDAVSGFEPRAQYDRIIATAGVWDVPANWLRQLREEGKLVVPIWLDGVQVSAAFTRKPDGSLLSSDNRPCAFVYLRGLAAGPRVRKRVGSTSLEILADDVDKIDSAALHSLLSDEPETHRLAANLAPEDYWYGFQLYLMLNEPPRYVFAVYSIPAGETAYGMEGNGILMFSPGSVAFAPYDAAGAVHSFGGSAAFMKMESLFEKWKASDETLLGRLRLRLIPKASGYPAIESGKLFSRENHYLHVWLD